MTGMSGRPARPAFARPRAATPVWHKDGDRWYYGYFDKAMPDLNLRNPDVTAALDDVARFWLDDLGVDGFRLDAARHLIEDGETLQNTPETFAWLAGFRGPRTRRQARGIGPRRRLRPDRHLLPLRA